MKLQAIKLKLAALLLGTAALMSAQAQPAPVMALGQIKPYEIDVSYDKTSHIIFPAGIRYVDLGSDNIIAGKAQDADNVLRVKAAINGFSNETNFSVITEEGQFYGFTVCFSETPRSMGYDLVKGALLADQSRSDTVRFESLGSTPASLTGLVMETLYERDKKLIRHIRSERYGVSFCLKGIYIHDNKYYFHLELENASNVLFKIDYIKFKITDRKVAKRTVVQERTLEPLRMYRPLLPVAGKDKETNIFLLEVFTLSKGQILEIEVAERNGGREQVLKIRNSDLVQAQPLDKLRVKL
jgi:conjugative transposon TraN protein